eukprot:Nk52_evm40s242 gene=Nk52_evmTU40s242
MGNIDSVPLPDQGHQGPSQGEHQDTHHKAIRKRQDVAREILTTEISYVNSLTLLKEVFIDPLERSLPGGRNHPSTDHPNSPLEGGGRGDHVGGVVDSAGSVSASSSNGSGGSTPHGTDKKDGVDCSKSELCNDGNEHSKQHNTSSSSPSLAAQTIKVSGLSKEKLRCIVSIWEVILNFHRKALLPQLQLQLERWGPSSRMGRVFIENVDFMRSYVMYVNNFEAAVQCLQECKRKSPSFLAFVRDCEKSERFNKLSLESYLIMPVQRLPRYILLLQELLKNTPSYHADHDELQEACRRMAQLAVHVNETKRSDERNREVLMIQQNITDLPSVKRSRAQSSSMMIKPAPSKISSPTIEHPSPSSHSSSSEQLCDSALPPTSEGLCLCCGCDAKTGDDLGLSMADYQIVKPHRKLICTHVGANGQVYTIQTSTRYSFFGSGGGGVSSGGNVTISSSGKEEKKMRKGILVSSGESTPTTSSSLPSLVEANSVSSVNSVVGTCDAHPNIIKRIFDASEGNSQSKGSAISHPNSILLCLNCKAALPSGTAEINGVNIREILCSKFAKSKAIINSKSSSCAKAKGCITINTQPNIHQRQPPPPPPREAVERGDLIYCPKSAKACCLYLFNDLLIVCSKPNKKGSCKFKAWVPLTPKTILVHNEQFSASQSTCKSIPIEKNACNVNIFSGNTVLFLNFETTESAKQWSYKFRATIKELQAEEREREMALKRKGTSKSQYEESLENSKYSFSSLWAKIVNMHTQALQGLILDD